MEWQEIAIMGAIYVGGRILEDLAKRTKTKVDDRAVKYVKDFLTLKFLKRKP